MILRRWALCLILGVLAMTAIGGITRLTDSGLSMVEWRPLLGWLPPIGEQQWQEVFALYRGSSEYRLQNPTMDLAAFRTIFWWEYVHRLAGRLFGLLVAGPLVWLWLRGTAQGRVLRLGIGIALLTGAQGLMGWLMVQSGLADRVDVSPLRLGMHFLLAVWIGSLAVRLWVAAGSGGEITQSAGRAVLRRRLHALAWVLGATLFAGALVAGNDGGLVHNDFPTMGGRWIPEDYRIHASWLADALENPAAAQWNHRLLAWLSLVLAVRVWLAGARAGPGTGHGIARGVGIVAGAQFLLGVGMLLAQVPLALALMHQLGGLCLFLLVQYGLARTAHDRMIA